MLSPCLCLSAKPRKGLRMDSIKKERPECPHCLSHNAAPLSLKTLAFTGAGGLVGGLVAAAVCNDNPDGVSAGQVTAGALAGAMAGLSVGKTIQKNESGKPYICLDCFRSFVY